jgi:spermidine synthase/MFS family permease
VTTEDAIDGSGGRDRGFHLEILLVSFAGLLLEIAYTRVVSFKLFYYYTYLVIGLALLGIGTGGVLVTISKRMRAASTEAVLCWSFLLGALSVLVGYCVVAWTGIDTLAIWEYGSRASFSSIARLLVICLALFSSFIAVGIVVSTLFGRRSQEVGRLYFFDLLGAGIACAIVVTLIGSIGPPATILLAGLVMAACSVRIAIRSRPRVAVFGGLLCVVLLAGVVAPSLLPDQREDATKVQLNGDNTVFSAWSPIFRVDVAQVSPDVRVLYHDGLHGSGIYRFNGDVSTLGRFDTDPRVFPFATHGNHPGRVLIIGAAGGNEVLASLHFGAGHIDAVELNPVTYHLVTDDMADWSGHLAENPKVNYLNGDGRSYLARSDHEYDLVWYPAPDSYSASNAASAGAFVLSESYLYTSETIKSSLEHLAPHGILAAQFGEFDYDAKPNRTTRYVATARQALQELGINDPRRHVMVATTPIGLGGTLSTILVSRDPFTRAAVDRFVRSLGAVDQSRLRWAPGKAGRVAADAQGSSAVADVASLPSSKLDAWYDAYPYDVRPISDNGPFFWHFNQFDDVVANFTEPIDRGDFEDSVGERVLLLLLGVAVAFAAVFLLLPFVAIRTTWLALPCKRRSALYFAALGLGFIFFEVTLIQHLTLFLGYPTYSLTVTLMSLLIFTGIGALLSERWRAHPRRVMPWLLATIVVLTAFYEWGLPPVTDALLGLALALRVLVAFVVLAPLGLCLGTFMPLGLGAVADLTDHKSEYVAWGWAVNGFASVVGAVLSTILAMSFGFRTVLLVALAIYLVALVALRGLLPPEPAAST